MIWPSRCAAARQSAFVALFLLPPSVATAQTDPRLTAAVRAAQEGQGDSARSTVDRLLAATPPTDTLYPQIVYTQAMVANTAADMRRHLQRVTVEYPTSSWADDALLRLVQMDYATRSFDNAARNLERLKLDFPLSPLLPQASYWAGRTYFELNDPTRACRWLAEGIAQSQGNVELQRQLEFLNQRCSMRVATADSGADTASARDTTKGRDTTGARDTTRARDTTSSVPRDTAAARDTAAPAVRFRVQVAAVATPGAADDAAEKAEKLGFPAVIIRERGFYKVRAGGFATRRQAQAALVKLKARFGTGPFVVAEP